jgi:hypothetical protein
MRNPIAFGLLASGLAVAAGEPNHSAWQWEQLVQVPQAGLVRVDLPPATLNASRPALADVRVLSPSGVETPYLCESPTFQTPRQREASAFTVQLREAAPNIEAATVVEFATGTDEPLAAVTLRSPAPEFIKSVTVEGTTDGENWQPVAAREVIFRQPNGTERLRLPLPPTAWRNLRLTLADARSRPIPVTSAGITLATAAPPATLAQPVTLRPAVSTGSTTQLAVDLGAANLHLTTLELAISDPVFSRNYTLAALTNDAEGKTTATPLARGTLYRVVGEAGVTTEQLGISVDQRVPIRQLLLTLQNGDSPPLTVTAASAHRFPTTLLFHATQAGAWSLLTGNPQASSPNYDLGPLSATLATATSQRLTPGAIRARAGFQPPPPLPGIDPGGAAIDLGPWSRRCAVQIPATGVVRIELKPTTLASANADLSDLRLVQDGRQLPYLIEPATAVRTIDCTVAPLPADPKRPGVSRWEVKQPIDGLRATALVATSPTPLFTRTIFAHTRETDLMTNFPKGFRGYANWTKTATTSAAANELQLSLQGTPIPMVLDLETTDGDNPPIEIDKVWIRFNAPLIAAKVVSGSPLFLYYGNPKATAPSYDLRLVRDELLAADKHVATLGGEEILKPTPASPWSTSAGSPWLWAALALVVGVLLVVVAKLLPARPPAVAD